MKKLIEITHLKTHYSGKRYFVFVMALAVLLGNSNPAYAAQPDMPEGVTETDEISEDSETSEVSGTSEITLPEITSFKELSSETSEKTVGKKPDLASLLADFPESLSVFLDGSETATDIPVTWSCTEDYENTNYSYYEFTPSWDNTQYSFGLTTSLDAKKDVPHIKVNINSAKASSFIMEMENARNDLEALAKEKDILALVYLCDTYDVKEKPDGDSNTVTTVTSGQSVQITGVNEDRNQNIWYRVSLDIRENTYSGFIKKENLAYSDEDLINWEKKYVVSYQMRTFSSNANGISKEISQFPSSYQAALTSLKNAHPNWIFVKMNTNISWSDAVTNENIKDRSLIPSSVNAAWKKGIFDKDKNWSYPTDGILAHYMDPRNFLNEDYIFQYELLSYNETYHTETAVQELLNNTFMSGGIPNEGGTYSQAFCSIAKKYKVSPFHLASRVRQEQGSGKSPLISGSYQGYKGLYNYFNIGATGRSDSEIIINGLEKAKKEGWNSRYLSLEGGSNIITKNYIQKGQDTIYLQKFNVDSKSPSGLYNHQYMQNIMAPSSESSQMKKAYVSAGSINRPFVFRIPVYENMPGTPCAKPTAAKEVSLNKTSLTLKIGETATLTASIDGERVSGSEVTFKNGDSKIASIDENGVVKAHSSGTTTVTCTAAGGTTASCTVTVQKTDPSYTIPSLDSVTYDSSQKLKDIKLPKGWTWDQPDTTPAVDNSGYPATFTPADTGKYNVVKKTIPLTVSKGTPSYTVPAGLQTVTGNTLASLKLPAGWKWDSPSTVLSKEGSVTYKASYNPQDTANYDTVTGVEIKIKVIAKSTECTTHSFGEWEHIDDPSCTTKGKDTRSCHICGYIETKTVPALGHQYTSKVTKEATCTEKGVKTFTCTCGDTYTEEIAATGHNYTSKVTKEATEKEEGIRTFTCSKCNHTYTEVIAKLPVSHKHSYTSKVTKEANCTEKGTKTYTCSCGDTYTEDIAALGHDMSEGKCKRCGYTEPKNNTGNNSNNNTSGNQNNNNSNATSDSNSVSTPAANSANTENSNAAPPQGTEAVTPKPSDKQPAKEETTAKNVTIDMKKQTVLYEEALSSIRGKDVDVVLSMGNSISWTINGSNIVYDEANGIDMGVKVNTGNIPSDMLSKASGGNENNTVIELSLAHDGPFDFSPVLTISTAKDNAGRMANLFYFNPEQNGLEFVDVVEISENGDITFTFSHASDYAVVISDESMEEIAVISNTDEDGEPPVEEDMPQDSTEAPDETKYTVSLSPKTILVVVIVIVVSALIGIAAYFILRPKSEDDYEEEEEEPEDDDDIDILEDEDDFIDDYREPEVKIKTTGKVVSLNKATMKKNDPEIGEDEFDQDEFDGFE